MKASAAVSLKSSVGKEARLAPPWSDKIDVRMVSVGLRHVDTAFLRNPFGMDMVLAHEGSGIVERVGNQVTKVKAGDHVILTRLSCGQCIPCQKAYSSCRLRAVTPSVKSADLSDIVTLKEKRTRERLQRGFVRHASFTIHTTVTERNVVKVASDAKLEILGPLGCGIQIGAGAVFKQLHVKAGSSIAIFGMGLVGLSAVMAALVSNCTTIIGVDINPDRLESAKAIGATHTIDASKYNPIKAIKKITGSGADYIIESTALPDVMIQAVESLGHSGICCLVGCARPGTQVTFDMNSLPYGRTICGIIEDGATADVFVPQLIDLYAQGRFPIERLLTFYAPNQIRRAINDKAEGRVIHPILRMR